MVSMGEIVRFEPKLADLRIKAKHDMGWAVALAAGREREAVTLSVKLNQGAS